VHFSGTKLRQLRENRGLSREYFAHQTGRSFNSIVSYELGRSFPKPDTLAAMAFALGVPMEALFDAPMVLA
jgi:transcriptional regulator with XRE-family HTH domain